jgi:hypothetical protein
MSRKAQWALVMLAMIAANVVVYYGHAHAQPVDITNMQPPNEMPGSLSVLPSGERIEVRFKCGHPYSVDVFSRDNRPIYHYSDPSPTRECER